MRIKILLFLLLFTSCASVGTLNRKQAYKINREYLLKKYNEKLENDKNTGFIMKNGTWIFTTIIGQKIYEVKISGYGEVIEY